MKITIDFSTSNAIFQDDFTDAIRAVMEDATGWVTDTAVDSGAFTAEHSIRDLFGNTIGKMTIQNDRE